MALIAGLLVVALLWLSMRWYAGARPPAIKRAMIWIACGLGLLAVLAIGSGRAGAAVPALMGAGAALWRAYGIKRMIDGWRAGRAGTQAGGGNAGTSGKPPTAGRMTSREAREILGLTAEASLADVKAAHRRLAQQMHPDRGGSSYLAGQINAARDVLIAELTAPAKSD